MSIKYKFYTKFNLHEKQKYSRQWQKLISLWL